MILHYIRYSSEKIDFVDKLQDKRKTRLKDVVYEPPHLTNQQHLRIQN